MLNTVYSKSEFSLDEGEMLLKEMQGNAILYYFVRTSTLRITIRVDLFLLFRHERRFDQVWRYYYFCVKSESRYNSIEATKNKCVETNNCDCNLQL